MFSTIYILAPYNTMRLSLFFLLLAGAFFKGRKTGRIWLGIILLTIVGAHALPYFDTGYSTIDIFSSCLYLIALFSFLKITNRSRSRNSPTRANRRCCA